MTPILDSIAIEFVKRIPTTFKTTFAGSAAMPDTYVLTAVQIVDFINRAMKKLFNDSWQSANGDPLKFSRLLPELVRYSDEIQLANGHYNIANPFLDFKRIIGGIVTGVLEDSVSSIFIKIWDDTKLTIALSGLYPEYIATSENPALIQMDKQLYLFPDAVYGGTGIMLNGIRLHYIALPVDPTTGSAIIQNGDYDCPFDSEWNTVIADYAYEMFLEESAQTM